VWTEKLKVEACPLAMQKIQEKLPEALVSGKVKKKKGLEKVAEEELKTENRLLFYSLQGKD